MKDCFCSEYIASVNNDNLNRLNTLRVVFNITNTSMDFALKNNQKSTIYMEDGKTFSVKTGNTVLAENVSSFDYQTGNTTLRVYDFSETGTLWITNKYNILNLTCNNVNIDFEISQLKYVQINKLILNINPLIAQNVNDLNLPYLTQLSDFSGSLNGKLEDLAVCPLILFSGASNIKGDILELAQAQVKAGRESATINGTGWSRRFNGTVISSFSNYQISWVKSGDNYVVTCKAGTTIESPSFNQSVTIDAQGNIVS